MQSRLPRRPIRTVPSQWVRWKKLGVFVEKPMTLDPEEARLLKETASNCGRILMVGHLLLYQPAIQFIKKYLDNGNLGKVFTLTQRRSKLGRVRSGNVLWSFEARCSGSLKIWLETLLMFIFQGMPHSHPRLKTMRIYI